MTFDSDFSFLNKFKKVVFFYLIFMLFYFFLHSRKQNSKVSFYLKNVNIHICYI